MLRSRRDPLSEGNDISIRISEADFASVPCLVDWRSGDRHFLRDQFRIERIDVVNKYVNRAASQRAAALERMYMQPYIIAGDRHIAGVGSGLVRTPRRQNPESEPFAIELFRSNETADPQDRNRRLKHVTHILPRSVC